MKKLLNFNQAIIVAIILSVLNATSLITQAVTIYTPNGTPVTAIVRAEMSQAAKDAVIANVQITWPNATILSEPSSRYNCHGYAWYLTEFPTCTPYWINTPEDDKYWNDGSYTEVCNAAHAKKISYADDDHSAVISSVSGKYESKWGDFPVMRHDPTYTPYVSTGLKYYIRTPSTITGPSTLCTTNTNYSLPGVPTGTTVTWSVSPSSLVATASGSGTTATIKAKSSSSSGKVTLTFIAGFCNNLNVSKTLWIGVPNYNALGASADGFTAGNEELSTCDYTYAEAEYNNPPYTSSISGYYGNSGISEYEWTIPYSSDWYIDEEYGSPADWQYVEIDYFDSNPPSQEAIRIRARNVCGWSWWKEFFWDVNDCARSLNALIVYPNPAEDKFTIKFSEAALSQTAQQAVKVVIYNDHREEVLYAEASTASDMEIDVSSIPSGTYYMHLFVNNDLAQKKHLIIK